MGIREEERRGIGWSSIGGEKEKERGKDRRSR